MKLIKHPDVDTAYQAAVVAVLNACPQSTEDEAEEVITSIATLIFTTMRAYLEEKENEPTANH